MRRRVLALFAGILVLGLMPGPALAAGVVDQSNEVTGNSWGPGNFAQTVTVGRTGKLTGVDLDLSEPNEIKRGAYIWALDGVTGMPGGALLTSASALVSTKPWCHFEFATPVSVISGGRFAIVFNTTYQGTAKGSDGANGSYSGGQALERDTAWASLDGDANLDFAFRTYVEEAAKPTASADSTPTQKPILVATAKPFATSSPTTTDTASPAASASASPSAQPSPTSGDSSDSGDSGGPPIVLIIVGIVALAAVLGGGIGLRSLLARRKGQIPPSS